MAKKEKKNKRRSLSEFLEQETIAKKEGNCFFCREKEVKEEVDQYLDLLQQGKTAIKLSRFHEKHVSKVFPGCPKSFSAIKRHVIQCLNRSNLTGEPLED